MSDSVSAADASSEPAGPRPIRVVSAAAAVQGIAMMPVFLTGALAVQMQQELEFGPGALGIATGAYVAGRAVTSVRLGRLVDQIGATRSLKIAVGGTAVTGLFIATVVHSWALLVVALLVGGVFGAVSQPAANRFVVRWVPPGRLGLAFGLKQSGPPAMIILAGLAVPVVALTIGWRWAFAIGGVLGVLIYLAVPRRTAPQRARAEERSDSGSRSRGGQGLGLVMLGMSFSLAAINSLQTFVVPSGVESGLRPAAAGVLLAAGGVLAITVRIAAGVRADRRGGGHFRFVARMLLAGAAGFLLMSLRDPQLYVLGAMLAYGSIWGMNGVLFMAVVRHNPAAPAAATGSTVAAASIGGLLGPPVAGFVVEAFGWRTGWWLVAGWALLSAICIGRSRAAKADVIP